MDRGRGVSLVSCRRLVGRLGGGRVGRVGDGDGEGIRADERDRVFDRFYRRHPGETTGSGIGLAIVRAIAERHRATIVLGDAPIGGLRVQVLVPMAREQG